MPGTRPAKPRSTLQLEEASESWPNCCWPTKPIPTCETTPATRRQESRQESAGEGFTEGRDEGCRQATAKSRRDSCCSGGDRVAQRSRRDASLAQRRCDRFRVKS